MSDKKTLELLKDEATINYFKTTGYAPTEWAVMNFQAGFQSSTAIHQERIKKLVEALILAHREMKMTVWREEEVFEKMTEALQEWRDE